MLKTSLNARWHLKICFGLPPPYHLFQLISEAKATKNIVPLFIPIGIPLLFSSRFFPWLKPANKIFQVFRQFLWSISIFFGAVVCWITSAFAAIALWQHTRLRIPQWPCLAKARADKCRLLIIQLELPRRDTIFACILSGCVSRSVPGIPYQVRDLVRPYSRLFTHFIHFYPFEFIPLTYSDFHQCPF